MAYNTRNCVDRTDYPELDLILWDRAGRYVPEEVAFAAYEKRWKFVDQKAMTPKEHYLLQRLTETFGNGLFLAA